MPRGFVVEDYHADEVLKRLADFEGLDHIRARRRADLLTLESGPKTDAIPHTRFRRVGVHRWQLEMPLRGGGWDRTPDRAQLMELLDAVIKNYGWMLARRD
jgi:hypothetical protein